MKQAQSEARNFGDAAWTFIEERYLARYRPMEDETRFVPSPEVCDRYGMSQMSFWRWINDPELGFPKPNQVRPRNFWPLAELVAWERATAAKRATA